MDKTKYIKAILDDEIYRATFSKPKKEISEYTKIVIVKNDKNYHVQKYKQEQVFHENIDDISSFFNSVSNNFMHINALSMKLQYSLMESKKGKLLFNKSANKSPIKENAKGHNREKNYILQEGIRIEPLIDINVLNEDGTVVKSMYDKFKQINRFIEIIDDSIKKFNKEELTILDFGCGKSYLTFVLYYYFTNIRKIKVKMIGLDLKESVINDCNVIAKKYNYDNLSFEIGDISNYNYSQHVDMVISLHACDTATDLALYSAIKNDVSMIFSVPCCQHEVNSQIKSERFSILTRHGIVKERISALFTDAIRSNLLECCSYKTQMLEFVDLSHTPKNILIRCTKTNVSNKRKKAAIEEIENLINEYNLSPKLYNLLKDDGRLS